MLQPQTGFFPFMDLPAEIRTMIYACLFQSDGLLRITTRKRVNHPRRPVPVRQDRNTRQKTTARVGKILPEGLNLLRTSKRMLQEAAPVLYGDNHQGPPNPHVRPRRHLRELAECVVVSVLHLAYALGGNAVLSFPCHSQSAGRERQRHQRVRYCEDQVVSMLEVQRPGPCLRGR